MTTGDDDSELPEGFSAITVPGTLYIAIKCGRENIGKCVPHEAGYLVFHKRKPVPTLYDAALQMLGDRLNQCRNEETKVRKMLFRLKQGKQP